MEFDQLIVKEQETKPLPLYNEATLIKALEQEVVGRPSTYASFMKTIIARVVILTPTADGIKVNQFYKTIFKTLLT